MLVFSVNTADISFERAKFDVVWKAISSFPGVSTVVLLHNVGRADIVTGEQEILSGSGIIEEALLGKTFEIAPKSFFQTNTVGAEALYGTVRSLMGASGGTLLDLYAGTGTIGTILGDGYERIFSVEIVADASRDALRNAKRNGLSVQEGILEKGEMSARLIAI